MVGRTDRSQRAESPKKIKTKKKNLSDLRNSSLSLSLFVFVSEQYLLIRSYLARIGKWL